MELLFQPIARDIEYEWTNNSPRRKPDDLIEVIEISSEDFYQYQNGHENRRETKLENAPSEQDTDTRYTGSVWPLPKHQTFKELVHSLCILDFFKISFYI